MRVVLDTNVLVSSLILPSSLPGRIYDAWEAGEFHLITSQYIIDEFLGVARLKFPQSLGLAREVVDQLISMTEVVVPADVSTAQILSNDWPILGTAVAGRADFLVTGDKLILNLKKYHGTIIVTPADFLNCL